MIDWSKMMTAEQKAQADLDAWRAGMSLPRLAFKAALLELGLLDLAAERVAEADPLTRLKWAEAVDFPRADPMIDTIGAQLGLTPEQIDELYRSV